MQQGCLLSAQPGATPTLSALYLLVYGAPPAHGLTRRMMVKDAKERVGAFEVIVNWFRGYNELEDAVKAERIENEKRRKLQERT